MTNSLEFSLFKSIYKVKIEGLVRDQFSVLGESSTEIINKIKEKYNSINAFSVENTIFIEVLNIK